MEEYKKLILGDLSVSYYLAAETFALLALIISLWAHAQKRDVASKNTPILFSWKFLLWDNIKRVVVGQITLFIIFRLFAEVFGKKLDMFWAVGIGFFISLGLDKVIQFIQEKYDFLRMPRNTDSSSKQ